MTSLLGITYDASAKMLLRKRLSSLQCTLLRGYLQTLTETTRSFKNLKKRDLVEGLLDLVESSKVQARLEKNKTQCSELSEDALSNLKLSEAVGLRALFSSSNRQPVDTILCTIHKMFIAHWRGMDARYSKATCDAGKDEQYAEYNPFGYSFETPDGKLQERKPGQKCPTGYRLLDENGCCINIRKMMGMWDTETLMERVKNSNMDEDERKSTLKMLAKDKKIEQELSKEQFESDADATMTGSLAAEFQKQMIINLGETFDFLLQDIDFEDDECDIDKVVEEKGPSFLERAKNYAMSSIQILGTLTLGVIKMLIYLLKLLWKLVKKILGVAYKTVKYVTLSAISIGYKIVVKLTSIGSYVAWFILTNPAAARNMLMFAKLVKKTICRSMASSVVDSPVLAALEYRVKQYELSTATDYKNYIQGHAQQMVSAARQSLPQFSFSLQMETSLAGIVYKFWDPSILTQFFDEVYAVAAPHLPGNFGFAPKGAIEGKSKATSKTLSYGQSFAKDQSSFVQVPSEKESFYPEMSLSKGQSLNLTQLKQREMQKMQHEHASVGLLTGLWNTISASSAQARDYVSEKSSKTFGALANAYDDVSDIVTDSTVRQNFVHNLLKSQALKSGMSKLKKVAVGTVSSIPVVGGFTGAVVDVLGDMLGEAAEASAEETLKMWMYYSNLTKSFELAMDFLSLEPCIRQMPGFKHRFPYLYRRFVVQSVTAQLWEKVTSEILGVDEIMRELNAEFNKNNLFQLGNERTEMLKDIQSYVES